MCEEAIINFESNDQENRIEGNIEGQLIPVFDFNIDNDALSNAGANLAALTVLFNVEEDLVAKELFEALIFQGTCQLMQFDLI